jgi:hypothetical protein
MGWERIHPREAQPGKIRIVGLDKEIDLPVMVQDKAHYKLFRDNPPPERYPLLNVKDILTQISMVYTSEHTTLRLRDVPIPRVGRRKQIDNPAGPSAEGWHSNR